MPLDPNILSEITGRFRRIRSGLAVGFADAAVADALRGLRGGVWLTDPGTGALPFEDEQFEVVVMDGAAVSRESVREANRVLRPEGSLYFAVPERTGAQEGYTQPEVYRMIREGFDILSVRRPRWWFLRRRGRTLTVCARKKAWHEHRGLIREGMLTFTPFRKRTR